jgi:hypothetical protein
MDTAKAARVMVLLGTQLKRPNWIALGTLVTKMVERMPEESEETIAESVISAYKNNVGPVTFH